MLLQILAACPAPASPQWTTRLPIWARIGSARANALAAPPAMKVRVAAFAPPTPPETGASSDASPCCVADRMRLARALDVDRRGIDDKRAGAHRRKDVDPDGEHMLAGGQHGDDHLGFRDGLAGGGCDRDAVGLGLRAGGGTRS